MVKVGAHTGNHGFVRLAIALFVGLLLLPMNAAADARDQAKRIHDRIAGTPPTDATLNAMEAQILGGDAMAAALIATTQPGFYNVTLKNFATPWTNRPGDVFAPLNDATATLIGMVRDDVDFRQLLYGDILYTVNGANPGRANNSNAHYENAQANAIDLQANLQAGSQSAVTGVPANATAGWLTLRGTGKSYLIDGTNRAMFRFTIMNHLCHDMEQVHDVTRTPDRIRQDVSRSPGGDSRIFLNKCIGCHSGMDPMAQALAYYDYERDEANDPEGDNGMVNYNDVGQTDADTGTRVEAKYYNNDLTFPYGFRTPDDQWANYWRDGPNKNLGWNWQSDSGVDGSGAGAKGMGQELAHSRAFAQCKVEQVFENVCLRAPADAADRAQADAMVANFAANNFSLRHVFAESAVYCMGN